VGLGLAISRVLVQRQGGRISLSPPDERGATFSVHLPRAGRAEDDLESGNGRAARRTPAGTD
jgi:signal transduction histidine kinase